MRGNLLAGTLAKHSDVDVEEERPKVEETQPVLKHHIVKRLW